MTGWIPCPDGYVLLALQIGFFALFMPLALGGVGCGYWLTFRGLDRLERKRHLVGACLFVYGASLAIICASMIAPAGFWLADCRLPCSSDLP